MATAASDVLKPDFESGRKHLIFTDEHEDLRESMKSWVLKELTPHAAEYEENLWPDSVLHRMAELGYVGLCFPEEYGGQGGDYYYSLVRAECLSYAASGGLGMGLAVHTDMVLPPIELLGTEDLKQRYLVPGIKGERRGRRRERRDAAEKLPPRAGQARGDKEAAWPPPPSRTRSSSPTSDRSASTRSSPTSTRTCASRCAHGC